MEFPALMKAIDALTDEVRSRDARIAELVRVIRYWIPDETMVPPEHKAAWDEHINSIGQYL